MMTPEQPQRKLEQRVLLQPDDMQTLATECTRMAHKSWYEVHNSFYSGDREAVGRIAAVMLDYYLKMNMFIVTDTQPSPDNELSS